MSCRHGHRSSYRKRRREVLKNFIVQYKESHPCLCGEKDITKLTFHHLNPDEKEAKIGVILRTGQKNRILKEIKKCVVLCRVCHDIVHDCFPKKDVSNNYLYGG